MVQSVLAVFDIYDPLVMKPEGSPLCWQKHATEPNLEPAQWSWHLSILTLSTLRIRLIVRQIQLMNNFVVYDTSVNIQ
jgi:hypothetical protein